MSRRYDSRRRSETMTAPRPVQSPSTDRSTVYAQRWRRRDGTKARAFDVLALDEVQAVALGVLRLEHRYRENPNQWEPIDSRRIERTTASIIATLMAETPAECTARDEAFFALEAAS